MDRFTNGYVSICMDNMYEYGCMDNNMYECGHKITCTNMDDHNFFTTRHNFKRELLRLPVVHCFVIVDAP